MTDTVVLRDKAEKLVTFKTQKGNVVSLVREVYLRSDIPCLSPLCTKTCTLDQGVHTLPSDVTHYIVVDGSVGSHYWEIFELNDIRGVVITLSTLLMIQQSGGKRLYNRVKTCLSDPGYGCALFDNEFHIDCFSELRDTESQLSYVTRLNLRAAAWYSHHLGGKIPIVLLTDNLECALRLQHNPPPLTANHNPLDSVLPMSLDVYLTRYWPDLSEARKLFESLTASLQIQAVSSDQIGPLRTHLPQEVLLAGIKSGQFMKGVIHVSKYNSVNEATVILSDAGNAKDASSLRGEVLIYGQDHRNRSVHGDHVCIEILPKSQWRSKPNQIRSPEAASGDASEQVGATDAVCTGRIIGILQRNWRDYVCSMVQPSTNESASAPPIGVDRSHMICTPWDRRVPRIRICTSQAAVLKTQRFIVRIDGWEEGSMYPHGHFVKSLGEIGDLETETQTILIEHNLANRPFTQAQLSELPINTPDHPWTMDAEEMSRRRDLRASHLIFSIDPIGCQDVDDTLSVRHLPSGNLELGVHIADVSYFVDQDSLLDVEARMRSTSVYMADRRFDMLPHTLSGVLCSLWSDVDRYAVSVVWEMTPSLEVVDVWYGRSLIRSRYKLYYELAQRIYEGKITDQELINEVPELQKLQKSRSEDLPPAIKELTSAVNLLVSVASRIKERRMKQGGLELEGLEVQVQFSDPDRTQMEDVIPKQPMEMHETIAECMIFANHWVARRILNTFPDNSCLRLHPPPRQEYFDELIRCARSKGFVVKTDTNKTLAESLETCVDPEDPEVNKILRSLCTQAMSNAQYFSTGSVPREQFAHYGLALNLYTHFTSPIRRYADIIVHRLLLAALSEHRTPASAPDRLMTNTDLALQSSHMNEKHRQAQYAQRCSTLLFQSLFFKSKPDTDPCRYAEAIVYQIKANGIIVHVPRYGMRSAVYLKQKDGTIAWLEGSHVNLDIERTPTSRVTWLPANQGARVDRVDESAVNVVGMDGRTQTYRLFDHIAVRIHVLDSPAHSLSLRLELIGRVVSNQKSMGKRPAVSEEVIADIGSKDDLIKSVRSADDAKAKKRRMDEMCGSDSEDEAFDRLHEVSSLYHLFLAVKQQATQD